MALCLAQDATAWERFDARFRPLLLQVVVRSLKQYRITDSGLAEETVAEVFSELLSQDCRALRRFQWRSSLATWLKVVTRRRVANLLRRRRRIPASQEGLQRVRGHELAPAERLVREERRSLVLEHLQQLSSRDRLALQLFYQGERSYREVAKALGLAEGRVGTILWRARERLGKSLASFL